MAGSHPRAPLVWSPPRIKPAAASTVEYGKAPKPNAIGTFAASQGPAYASGGYVWPKWQGKPVKEKLGKK